VERRLAITYIVSATTTFGIACVAIATASGGLFASAAPKPSSDTQVEIVDDYIVVHSSTTTLVAVDPPVPPGDSGGSGSASPPAARGAAAPAGQLQALAAPDAAPVPVVLPDAPVASPTEAVVSAASQGEVSEAPSAPQPAAAAPSSPSVPAATQPPATQAPAPTVAPAPVAPTPTTVAAARPPIPDGCVDPRFRNGAWKCDD